MASRDTFEASYPGHCDACGERYSEGAEIGFVGDYTRPVCEDCWYDLGGDDD